MPPRYATFGVVLVLLIAGCSMLPSSSDGGDGASEADSKSHHELVFASDLDSYNATVTVTQDGEQVYRTNVSGEDGMFVNLTTLANSGPYTVSVETDVSVGGEPMSEQFQIPAAPGNATVIELDYASITTTQLSLPREELSHPLGAYSNFQTLNESKTRPLQLEVRYRGELVATASLDVPHDELIRGPALNRTGVYTVRARTDDGWTQESVIVTDPETYVRVEIGTRGDVEKIHVKKALAWG